MRETQATSPAEILANLERLDRMIRDEDAEIDRRVRHRETLRAAREADNTLMLRVAVLNGLEADPVIRGYDNTLWQIRDGQVRQINAPRASSLKGTEVPADDLAAHAVNFELPDDIEAETSVVSCGTAS